MTEYLQNIGDFWQIFKYYLMVNSS